MGQKGDVYNRQNWTNKQAGIRRERGYGGDPVSNWVRVHLGGMLPYPWFPLYPCQLVSVTKGGNLRTPLKNFPRRFPSRKRGEFDSGAFHALPECKQQPRISCHVGGLGPQVERLLGMRRARQDIPNMKTQPFVIIWVTNNLQLPAFSHSSDCRALRLWGDRSKPRQASDFSQGALSAKTVAQTLGPWQAPQEKPNTVNKNTWQGRCAECAPFSNCASALLT